jgi:predicted Zn-dependent protease
VPLRLRPITLTILLASLTIAAFAQTNDGDTLLATMKQELNRNMKVMKSAPVPPYFLSYQLTDNRAIQITSSFGALTASSDRKTRLLDIDIRVGDYKRDNTHPTTGESEQMRFRRTTANVPVENDSTALTMSLWKLTDEHYREALQQYEAVKTNDQVGKANEDNSPDFSPAPVEKHVEPDAPYSFSQSQWEEKVRKYGQPFRSNPDLVTAEVDVTGEVETRRYINSEGSEIKISMPLYRLMLSASIRTADGEVLPIHRDFMSFTPEGLPSDETVVKTAGQMVEILTSLQKAPVGEPYTGPAILSGRASAVFFHEIFGHRIEGARLKGDDDAQTFKNKINQSVLPKFLSVYSDPASRQWHGQDLVGFYEYDDEGVKAHRVTVVENGVFKNFLMSRSPIKGFDHSNGHGRRQQGNAVAARQSNLLVEASQSVSRVELKKLLIARIKAANKPYGLLFDDIEGGYTFTSRYMPNAFSVMPTVVYRIYPDGKEELVRGLDLIGTPLIAFSKISAADNEPGIFNGLCGAESGWVPVSATAPGMLIDQIEIQRKQKSQDRKPILPAPTEQSK